MTVPASPKRLMALSAGTRLGSYEILAPLGAGGMGEVYRARDTRLRRDVAIKILPDTLASVPAARANLEREAQAVAALSHPNILSIFEFDIEQGVAFAVMELLDGETLRDRLAEGAIGSRKAIDYAQQIAAGLGAAHARRITHCDLKPENIFVTRDGRVKILDFGVAKVAKLAAAGHTLQPAVTATWPGTVVGTVGYMSPEQVRGSQVDHRTDIFSFGAILYEMLAGQRAFTGDSAAEKMNAVLKEEPPALTRANTTLPRPFDRIVRRCLEKNPDERFESIRDVAFALEAVTTERSDEAFAEVAGGRENRATFKRALMFAAVVALLAAVGAIGFIFGARRSTSSPPRVTRLTFDRGTIRAARFTPDGKTVIYGASWGGQPIKVFQTRIGSPESIPLQLPDAEVLAVSSSGELAISVGHRFRGWVGQGTLARAPLVGGSFREVVDNVRAADWSPDGKEFAIVRRVNGKDRLEYPFGTVVYETTGYISHPRVSPSGDIVAYHDHPVFGDDRGWVSIVTRTGQRRTLTREWAREQGLAWSRDGREIWFAASETGRNMLFGVTLDGALRQIWAAPADLTVLDIGLDGHVLATANTMRTEIKWMPADDSQERDISFYAWSFAKDLAADGKMVLLTRFDEGAGFDYQIGLRRIDAPTGVVLGQGVANLFSPDNKWIIGLTYSQPSLFLVPTGAGERRTLTQPGYRYITAGWLPDGKRIIFVAQENNLLSAYVQGIAGDMPVRVSAAIPALLPDWPIRVSPDGSWFFGAQAAGPPVVVPVSGGAPRALNDLGSDDVPVAWTPDGRAILIVRESNDQTSAVIVRFDLATGRMQAVREVKIADKSGARGLSCIVTPDVRTVVCNVGRYLTDLYLVEGLK
jgi:eukaryotic-like serine/threonine-protein kinase